MYLFDIVYIAMSLYNIIRVAVLHNMCVCVYLHMCVVVRSVYVMRLRTYVLLPVVCMWLTIPAQRVKPT